MLLVVMGKSQSVVSECVWWLANLISPIPFCGDFRPYLTIQDADFKKYSSLFKNDDSKSSSSTANPFYQQKGESNSRSSVFLSAGVSSPKTSTVNQATPPKSMSTVSVGSQKSGSTHIRNSSQSEIRSKHSVIDEHVVDARGCPTRSILVGVTNPFFIRAFECWPNCLKVVYSKSSMEREKRNSGSFGGSSWSSSSPSKPQPQQQRMGTGTTPATKSPRDLFLSSVTGPVSTLSTSQQSLHKASSFENLESKVKQNMAPPPNRSARAASSSHSGVGIGLGLKKPSSSIDLVGGFTSPHKPFLKKDKKFVKALQDAYYESVYGTSTPVKSKGKYYIL
jgi:hypothetical protein